MGNEVTFTEEIYEIAKKQCLYWMQNGNDAEEVTQWLNIVFAIEDRMQAVADPDDEQEEG
jgi:hypothetical protein